MPKINSTGKSASFLMLFSPKSRVTVTCVILVFFFALFYIMEAQEISPRLAVSPHTFELRVERSQVLKDKIKILNESEVAIPMIVKVTDFTAEEETGRMIFDTAVQDPSFASRLWIKIENPNFILDPNETEEVFFSIEVPENAEPGGHYATVLFEPQLPSYYFKEGQVRAIPIIGVLFLFSVEVEGLTRPERPLTVVEFTIPENLHIKRLEKFFGNLTGLFSEVLAAEKETFTIVETSHLPFTLRIKNNDIYHIKPSGKLVISTAGGKIVGKSKISKTTILPGKVRKFPVEFQPDLPEKLEKYLPAGISQFISKNLFWGKYRANLLLTTNNTILEKDIEFWVFPWKVAAIVFIMVIALILIRKRIVAVSRVLIRKNHK